ncbi:MAG: hypothetical protein OWU84_12545 [Firmicutes bacterium]|nr:hypothetical protein [Bacillota bacterium]
MKQEFQDLYQFLSTLALDEYGGVPKEAWDIVGHRLASIWGELQGARQEGMAAWKLFRIEDVRWHPPILSFVIERHGALMLGSSRATLQEWAVDLEARTAVMTSSSRYRQRIPRQPPVKVSVIVDHLLEAIRQENREEPGLLWGRNMVRVVASRIFPPASQETMRGRRQRLWKALDERASELESAGWTYDAARHAFMRKNAGDAE